MIHNSESANLILDTIHDLTTLDMRTLSLAVEPFCESSFTML